MLTQSFKNILFLLILITLAGVSFAQDMKGYSAQWEGKLMNRRCFSIRVAIRQVNNTSFNIRLSTATASLNKSFKLSAGNYLEVKIGSGIVFKGTLEKQNNLIEGFIESGMTEYHVTLNSEGSNTYTCKWNILAPKAINPGFYLDIENGSGDKYEAYAFSGDPRFSGFNCYDFNKKNNLLLFKDFRTGLGFEGRLLKDAIDLRVMIAGLPITNILLHKSVKEWDLKGTIAKLPFNNKTPDNLNDGLPVNSLKSASFDEHYLKLMVDSINTNQITNTQSVLISRNGKLVYEQYFGGFDEGTIHDMRSASKSISSAIIGIAMDKGLLKDTSQKLFSFLPTSYKDSAKDDERKQAISIGNLLTMSSGLDAIDFGIDRKSVASEDEYQQTPDWLKTIVNAPMISYPGTHANYSSANPYLLGVILSSEIKQPLELFIDHNLFEPLGISNYTIQSDDKGKPYFGGGMFLRPRDMLKFGLLYAQNGEWNARQVISKKWIDASFKNYIILENHSEKPGYGFLWWHYTYKINGKIINSIEARGAGGQYIFIIPQYQLVVVITSGNFKNHRVWQPEKIVENYILPAVNAL